MHPGGGVGCLPVRGCVGVCVCLTVLSCRSSAALPLTDADARMGRCPLGQARVDGSSHPPSRAKQRWAITYSAAPPKKKTTAQQRSIAACNPCSCLVHAFESDDALCAFVPPLKDVSVWKLFQRFFLPALRQSVFLPRRGVSGRSAHRLKTRVQLPTRNPLATHACLAIPTHALS